MQVLIQAITHWDIKGFNRFFGLCERSLLGRLLPAASRTADGPWYVPVLWSLWIADPEGATRIILAALVAFGIELPLYKFIKTRARRPRPFSALRWVTRRMDPPDEFSFPSGHTAAAFLMVTLLSVWNPVFLVPGALWASLVGVSRVYLGVHYPTDVLAGIVLGISSAAVGLWAAASLL